MQFPVKNFKKYLAGARMKALVLSVMLGGALNAFAVTEAEMDHARAIAAKFYVRYINDGAGYLDNWLPGSMSELEKKVSNKTDKENLNKFKSAAYPTDYASWDKAKLVAYWGEEFFNANASSLDSKAAANALCKRQIKKAVEGIKVEAPAPAAAPSEAAPAQEEAVAPIDVDAEEAALDESLADEAARVQEAQDQVEEAAKSESPVSDSGTWVYIMVLGILVAIVIVLVIFASRTMKNQSRNAKNDDAGNDEEEMERGVETAAPVVENTLAEETKMREKYARTLASKSEEIRSLTRQLADMEALAARLKDDNRRLTAEVERLRNDHSAYQPSASDKYRTEPRARQREQQHGSAQEREAGNVKEIYLGRVNSKGLFVRADRHAVDGQSVYKLTTSNGVSGTYTLINNPLIIDQVLEDPGKWLAGGCFAKDIFDTEGREDIHTETPGTAVFTDGAWRVERKAKIRYE